jgi:soluble lytic murein transglycosylase-like protein
MLKFRLRDLAATLLLAVAVAGFFHTSPPRPIQTVKLTEQSIKEGFDRERSERATGIAEEKKRKAIALLSSAAGAVYHAHHCGRDLDGITGRVAYETGLSPRLIAAVVFVESTCQRNAISGRSSVGVMQINPAVWSYSQTALLDPEQNIRIGARILKEYVRKFGIVEGLHHFNGLGNPTNEYATRVLNAEGWTIISREEAHLCDSK